MQNFMNLNTRKKMIGRAEQKLLTRGDRALEDKKGKKTVVLKFLHVRVFKNTFLCKEYMQQQECRLIPLQKKWEYLLKRRHAPTKRIG